jgi:uncharacterized protein YjbI with pentapeptide repeats
MTMPRSLARASATMFYGAVFGDHVSFEGANFAHSARFEGAVFGEWASFVRATFGDVSSFDGSAFGRRARFDDVTFGDSPWFDGAAFGDETSFQGAFFKGQIKFTGTSIEQWAWDFQSITPGLGPDARKVLEQRHEDLRKTERSGPDSFRTISFAGASFDGEADFSGRSFERTADFTNARFYYPPIFDAVTKSGRIDFTGAHIGFVPPGEPHDTDSQEPTRLRTLIGFVRPSKLLHWTGDSRVPVRLRAFRKVTEETKNHDLERDLYIEERKAERGVYWHQQRQALKNAPIIEKPLIFARLMGHGRRLCRKRAHSTPTNTSKRCACLHLATQCLSLAR